MESLKKIVKVPSFWVILVLIVLGVMVVYIVNKVQKQGYLLLSNVSSYQCNKKGCKNIDKSLVINNAKSDFQVFQYGENLGIFKLKYISKWNFFDQNNNWINISDNYIAGSEEIDLNVINFDKREMNDEEILILEKYLAENGVAGYSFLEQNEVVEHDFNKDGKKEKILFASNASDVSNDEKLFSIVISVVNKKTSVLHIDIYNTKDSIEVPIYQAKGIINIFNNKNDYFILLKGYFSEVGKSSTYIYQINNNKMVNIVKNN